MTARAIGLALIVSLLFGAGVVVWLSVPSIDGCALAHSVEPHVIAASKVVVQPWRGEHHVYGIFVVPGKYGDEERYRATMIMPVGSFVVEAGGERENTGDLLTPPGYYSKRVYVPTRLVLWKALTGQLERIGDPCSWTIEFTER